MIIGLARAACAAKHLAEYVAKVKALRAAKSAETAKSACAAKAALFKGGVSVLVVGGFFLRVGQSVVGFLDFFEFFRRFFGVV